MDRLDFFSSLPFLIPLVGESEGCFVATSGAMSLRGLQLSIEVYSKTGSVSREILGPVYFCNSSSFQDHSLTMLDVAIASDNSFFRIFIECEAEGNHDSANQGRASYQVLEPPFLIEFLEAQKETEKCMQNHYPASLILRFGICAWRLFFLSDDKALAKTSLLNLQKRIMLWKEKSMTAKSAPPSFNMLQAPLSLAAAQSFDSIEPNNHHRRRSGAMVHIRTHLESLQKVLYEAPDTQSTIQVQAKKLFEGLSLDHALYCGDETDRQFLESRMRILEKESLTVQQSLRQLLDSYFPIQGRKRHAPCGEDAKSGMKGVLAEIGKATSIRNQKIRKLNDAEQSIPNFDVEPVKELLGKYESISRDKHALGISVMPRMA